MKYALISIVLGVLGGVAGAFGASALLNREAGEGAGAGISRQIAASGSVWTAWRRRWRPGVS